MRPPAEALLEFILDATEDAVLTVDTGGRVTSWNVAAGRLLGVPDSEAVGQPAGDLLVAARASDRKPLRQALDGQRIDGAMVELRNRAGMRVMVRLHAQPLLDGPALVLEDFTERQETQQILAEAQQRLRDLEQLGHVGTWRWDPGSGEVQWSEQLFAIHGVDPAAFTGTLAAHVALVHEDSRERIRERLAETADAGASFEAEYQIVTAAGEERWLYSRADPVADERGRVDQVVGIVQDVTPTREMLAAAERAQNDLERFAFTVAHDLKEPLATIHGFAELLADDLAGDAAAMLQRITANAQRAVKLIEDLLAEMRAGHGTDETAVDLAHVVDWVADTLEERLSRTGSRIEHGTLPVVRGREPLLRQAVLNCVLNAVKYRPEGRGATVRITGQETPQAAIVRIEDDGPGIPPEARIRVLTVGERLERDVERGIEGTGLGLATVRSVVERHGGTIAIGDSELGGACLTFEFPKDQARSNRG